jgi:TPR repeat protein
MRQWVGGVLLLVSVVGVLPGWAGADEAMQAYDRGDYATAFRAWLPQAQQGSVEAQYNLGLLYAQGQGVPQDEGQAIQWFRRAADQGYAPAQYSLGVMYAEGRGVSQNVAEAYFWLTLAAARFPPTARENHDIAVHNRDFVAARITSAQRAEVQARVSGWQPTPETPTTSLPTSLPIVKPVTSPPLSHRDRIRQVQERLHTLGFKPGAIDGTIGPHTQKALRLFQKTKGLLATGELDEKTLDALEVQ